MRAIVIAADARQVSPRSKSGSDALLAALFGGVAGMASDTSKSCPVRCYFIITIPTHAVCSLARDGSRMFLIDLSLFRLALSE